MWELALWYSLQEEFQVVQNIMTLRVIFFFGDRESVTKPKYQRK